jgi:hypothetical protein
MKHLAANQKTVSMEVARSVPGSGVLIGYDGTVPAVPEGRFLTKEQKP